MRDIPFAIYDIWRKKWLIFILMIELLIAFIYGSFTISLMHSTVTNYQALKNVWSHKITQFKPITYNNRYSQELTDMLGGIFTGKSGYAAIEWHGQNVIFIFGAFTEVFPLQSKEQRDFEKEYQNNPYCFIGHKMDLKIGDFISIGEYQKVKVPIVSTIDKGAYYLNGVRRKVLDQSIVIFMDFTQYLSVFYARDILENTCLLDANGAFLSDFMNTVWDSGMVFEPIDTNDFAENDYKKFIESGAVFSLLLGIGLIFTIVHVFICIISIIDTNMREYSIHLVYGGLFSNIFKRCFYVVLFILGIPVLVYVYALPVTMIGEEVNGIAYAFFVFASGFFICYIALRKLRFCDISMYFQRSE